MDSKANPRFSILGFALQSSDNVDLAQLHRLQGGLVTFGGDTCAAISDDIDRNFGQSCLCQNGIGHNADAGA